MLSTPADVSEMLKRLPLLGWHTRRRVSVHASGMGAEVRHRWERRLTLWLTACGCETGALLSLSALVWRLIILVREPPRTLGGAAASVGWVFGAAVIGKIGGLAGARLMLIRDLERLRRHMDAPSSVRP